MSKQDGLEGLNDVTPVSSAGQSDEPEELETETTEEDSAGADSVDDSDEDGKKEKSGRTLENVKREAERKIEALSARMDAKFDSVMDTLKAGIPGKQESKSDAPKSANQLDDLSVQELKNMQANVPEESREAFKQYLLERMLQDEFGKLRTEVTQQTTNRETLSRIEQKVVNRYPDLTNPNSDLRQRVSQLVSEKGGKAYLQKHPQELLNIANEVAIDLGVSPQASGSAPRQRFVPQQPVANKSNKPVNTKDSKETITDEKYDAISRKLEAGIPGLKFNKKRVKERHKGYTKDKTLYVK